MTRAAEARAEDGACILGRDLAPVDVWMRVNISRVCEKKFEKNWFELV